jgi:hypothetical protein
MAATVQIHEKNGAGETPTDKTSGTVRFKNADDATVDANNPLIVPSANREYSYEKFLRTNFNSAPDTNITNLEAYMDGSKGWAAGVKLWARDLAAFTTPAVPTETNDPPEIPVNGTPAAATDMFTYTTGSPMDLGAGPFTGTGDKGDYICLVMEVEIGSGQGALATETLTIRYDEI